MTPTSANPEKGSTGDVIFVQGPFDPEDVKAVKILDQDAYVLNRDKDGLRIKLPDFPELNSAETDAKILVMGDKSTLSEINFKVSDCPSHSKYESTFRWNRFGSTDQNKYAWSINKCVIRFGYRWYS